MKRLLDILGSICALGLLLPIMIIVAIAILLETGRPVFFKQRRIGKNGTDFEMFKFRSMVKNAAHIGPYFTSDNDARITRVGQFIRRTSIDELPQLLNVLLGDMSLVGPRPDVPAQRSLYTPEQWRQRCEIRPGITGLAQALLRSEATAEQRLELDLRYVKEVNLLLDVKIMWWTLSRLTGKGSN